MQNIENNIQNQIDPLSIDLSGAPIQPQRVKKYDFTLRGKDRIFSLFILIATVCFVTLGLFGQHLGLTLSFVLLFSVVTASLITKQTKIRPFPAVCGILAVVGSAVYSFSDDPSVNALLFFSDVHSFGDLV